MPYEQGPVYGVPLISELPLSGGMIQAMPSRDDLERVRKVNERTVAGYEVLLNRYLKISEILDAHRRYHGKVGCAGRPECPVCAEEEWF